MDSDKFGYCKGSIFLTTVQGRHAEKKMGHEINFCIFKRGKSFDGIEVLNFHIEAKTINESLYI